MTGRYELLEHTADVGIHAWGATLAEALEAAAWGVVDLLGIRVGGPGERRQVRVRAEDPGGLAVDLLNELILLHELEGAAVAGLRVLRATDTEAEAEVELAPLPGEPAGTVVKAATYHQLRVAREADGSVDLRVFVDV